MRLPILLTVFIVPWCSGTALALTLNEAESLWQQNSRELRLASNAVDAARADLLVAGQRPNPEFSVNVSSISANGSVGAGKLMDKQMDTVFRIDQLIERGDKRAIRQQGAMERIAATRQESVLLGRQQQMQLRRAYYDLKLVQERLRLTGESAELMRRTLQAGRLRLQVGDVAAVDVSRLAIDQARVEGDHRQAEADLISAQQALAYLTGMEEKASTLEATDDWPAAAANPPDLPASDGRPEIEAARHRVAAAEADRALARAKRSRDITVGVQYERNPPGAPLNSYGVGISMPLHLWHTNDGDVARAEADVDASRNYYELQKAQLTVTLAQARANLQAAQARLQRLNSGLLDDATHVAEAAELAYSKGAMGLLDLLDTRRTQRQLQLEAATTRADYAKALSDWVLLTAQGNTQ